MKKLFFLLFAGLISASLLYTGCSKDDEDVLENVDFITVTPEDVFLAPGQTQQFAAVATFLDGTSRDVTSEVTWKSSNTNVATITATGLATGKTKGFAFISATSGTYLGSTQMNVMSESEIARAKAMQDYNDNYLGSENPSPGWTGSVTGCNKGTISQASYDKVIQRINYFRRLCGLADNITLKTEYSAKCQMAALMFKANNTISHYPPTTWLCYHADGDEAAGKSNIAIGFHTSAAVSAYIEDFGANNLSVGHRRWLLFTKANAMGEGSTDNTNAIWVFDHLSSAPAGTPAFVAYPPKGYVPAPLVFPRWSLMIPGATFTNATVTMKDAQGNTINCNVIDKYTGGGLAGDPAIVWEPAGINTSGPGDVKYTVTVAGITGPQATVTYDVIIAQPGTKLETEYERIKRANPQARVE
ncbi:MAG TPA: Ig-like domain-containing protein [Bacteroidales bacterium]|nr:Ig-like domain-containing protein [Bacteroidales bacterium]